MANREVVVTYRIATADTNRAEMQKLADDAKRLQQSATTETKKNTTTQTAFVREYYKNAWAFADEYFKRKAQISRELKDRELADTKAAMDAVKRGYAERERLGKQQARQDERDQREALRAGAAAQRERERLGKQSYAASERASKQQEVYGRRLISASLAATNGIMDLARGFALLGIAGEKDTAKIVEGLIKVEAAFGFVRGGIVTVMSLAKVWNIVEKAAKAAAVAQAAASATGKISAGGGLLGGLGSVIGGSTAGMAGLWALAAAGGTAGIAATHSTIGAINKYGLGGGYDEKSIWAKIGGSRWNPLYWPVADWEGGGRGGSGPSPERQRRNAEAKSKRMQEAYDWSHSQTAINEELSAIETGYAGNRVLAGFGQDYRTSLANGVGSTPELRRLDQMRQQSAMSAGRISQAEALYKPLAGSGTQGEMEALKTVVSSRRESLSLQQQAAQASIRQAQAEGQVLSQLKEQQRARQQQIESSAVRAYYMSPEERQLARAGYNRLQRGLMPTQEQIGPLTSLAGQDVTDTLGRTAKGLMGGRLPEFAGMTANKDVDTRLARDIAEAAAGFKSVTGKDALNTSVTELADVLKKYVNEQSKRNDQTTKTMEDVTAVFESAIAELQKKMQLDDVQRRRKAAEENQKNQ